MVRPACYEPPGLALHAVQRARDGAACFFCDADRIAYLEALREFARRGACAVHAYVLMGNHVHVLATSARPRGVSRLIAALAARHGRRLAERQGPEAQHWSEETDLSPVHERRHLIACMRYIEMNPVRARIAARPQDYRWSSFAFNALGRDDPLVAPHPFYYALGRDAAARRAAYLEGFAAHMGQ
jgi:putative transposase